MGDTLLTLIGPLPWDNGRCCGGPLTGEILGGGGRSLMGDVRLGRGLLTGDTSLGIGGPRPGKVSLPLPIGML